MSNGPGYMMISADDHIDLHSMPRDVWLERMPKSLKDRAPHVEDRGEKGEFWVCDGETWADHRGERWWSNPSRPVRPLDRGGVAEPYRSTTPRKRLEDMDADGVEASVIYPAIVPMQVGDPDLRNACIRAYNDWALDFRSAAPKRFLPMAMLSPLDPLAAVDEVHRVAKLGFRQVNFLVNDVTVDMYLKSWDPFWTAAAEAGLIVSYHVGGSPQLGTGTARARSRDLPPEERRPAFNMGVGNGSTSFFEPFVNLFSFGTLERHPSLKLVLGESGTGWIPFVVQELDYRYRRALETRSADQLGLEELPSEVFKRQVWATYQTDVVGLHLVEFFGDGHMLWASDYPHPDGTFPFSKDVVERDTAHLAPQVKRKILRDNASALYGL